MAGQWVDDPSWGNVFKDFFPDPGKPGQAMLAAEHVKKLQLERAMSEEQLAGIRRLIEQQNQRYNAMPPPATEVPMPPNFSFGPEGTPATVTPAEPLRLENVSRSWGVNEPFYRGREEARAVANLAPWLAKSPEALLQGNTGSTALAQLQLYGVPPAGPARDLLQTQLSTIKAEMPGYKTQPAPHNYAIIDPLTGEHKPGGRTFNGLTDADTGLPLPRTAMMAGPATLESKSPFASADTAKAELMQVYAKYRRDAQLDINDTERTDNLLERAYPREIEYKQEGDRLVARYVRKTPIPPALQPLADLVTAYRAGAHLQPPGQRPDPFAAPSPVPFVPPAAVPSVGAGTAALPPPAPVVPAPTRPPMSNVPSEPVVTGPISAEKLADNLRNEPDYKTYLTSVREWNGLARYAQGGPDGLYNNATDLAMIYGIAKLFDPDSAVREGELHLTQNLGAIGETLTAWYTRTVQGGGILPAKVRADLLYAGKNKMDEAHDHWRLLTEDYTQRAVKGGADPNYVVRRVPDPRPLDFNDVLERGRRSGTQPERPPGPVVAPAPAPAAPVPRSVIDRLLQGGP